MIKEKEKDDIMAMEKKKSSSFFNQLNSKNKPKQGNQNINKVSTSRIKSQGRGR